MNNKINLEIREAMLDDAQLYFEWANDPLVRQMAFHTEPILWENHIVWFRNKIVSPDSHLLLCFKQGIPIGQVRFDVLENGKAEIDISIVQGQRGNGLGKIMLEAAIEYECCKNGIHEFVSEVKEENISSQKLFLNSGFQLSKREGGVFYYYKNI